MLYKSLKRKKARLNSINKKNISIDPCCDCHKMLESADSSTEELRDELEADPDEIAVRDINKIIISKQQLYKDV